MSEAAKSSAGVRRAESASPLVVVDLGKQKRGRIKKLRRGSGPLVAKVQGVIDELRAGGTVGENAQPVVIVVREKQVAGLLSGFVR